MMGRDGQRRFVLTFIGVLALIVFQVHSQDQSGFISIDCGIPGNSTYTDSTTGLNYVSDAAFIDSGVTKSVAPGFSTDNIDRQLWYVRSFPDGDRNCYNISLTQGTKYLIRATFMYGNYDGLNKLPTFDLHLGTVKWVNVEILNASNPVIRELIHIPSTDYIYVCLVNNGSGTPFISALEIRPLKNNTYVTQFGSLVKFTRLDVGSATNLTVRYPDDVYDRLWTPDHFYKWTDISTTETIDANSNNFYQPPSTVMRTAGIPANVSEPMEFYIDTQDTTQQFYVYMHFAEIEELQANQSRMFNVTLNGKTWYESEIPEYLYTNTIYSPSALSGGKYVFSLFKTGNSTLPPLLNAIEIYYVVDLSQLLTNQGDVNAVTSIKSTYGIRRNWQGDPCAPQGYTWEGLNCSYVDDVPPTIIALNLSSSALTGVIDPEIANLNSLESLDLSNNSVTGQVPDFLSQLASLKTLILTGNNLTGTVPAALVQRSKSGSLFLSVSGNPNLCLTDPCTKKKKKHVVVPVVASIAAAFALVVAATVILLCILRWRKQPAAGKVETEINGTSDPLELTQRQFSYPDILKMTNNFAKILGKGGFGTVYHGYLGETEVAVKMLSPSSVQGYKEFQAEVKLLLRVHHRNLTSLVGYCNEGPNMGLVYEYMANGNLEDHLSDADSSTYVLSWEARLRIALEAAQGLEYLHNGCKPPIVHRDVKTTNILLNDRFQAKLADFGLSRTFPVEGGTHVSTIVAGTPGYLDPEYYVTNWLTEKKDVYSFGIVLLEIVASRPVIAKTQGFTHISQWVGSLLEKGDIKSIVDKRLRGEFDVNSVWKVVELAMNCVSSTSAKRPTMSHVVVELNECLTSEMARSREGYSYQSRDSGSVEMMTVYMHTGTSPLVR